LSEVLYRNENQGVNEDFTLNCDGEELDKIKYNKFYQETTSYAENYEMGLINDRIIFEVKM